MDGLEIVFILSTIAVIVMWGWFVMLGFRANRLWGAALLLLFPLSPFAFAYRFERKTRKILYPFIGSLVFFAAVTAYAIGFRLDFFPNFATKLGNGLAYITVSKPDAKKANPLNLPKPVEIPVIVDEPMVASPEAEVVKEVVAPKIQKRGYKEVSVASLSGYIGKKIQLTTSTTVHEGKLLAVSANAVEIKKKLSGGATVMSVDKTKISKVEVYL
jgi:hypothetical protein